jgi:hypothetical protein
MRKQREVLGAERKSRVLRVALVAVAVACSTCLPAAVSAQTQDTQFAAAAHAAARLAPAAFAALPPFVEAALRENGCAVPQYRFEGDTAANNVIQGEFAGAGQLDFASLCSRDARTSLLVVWGGPARCEAVTKEAADVEAMVGAGTEILYTRQIQPVARSRGQEFVWLATAGLQELEHDGILHSVGEYQTSFLYCRDGEWMEIEPEPAT